MSCVAGFVYLCPPGSKMAQNPTCIEQTLLHETQSTVIHSLGIFIKKLQGKCMGNYCLCSRTKFTPFIGFEGDGNELLLWPCHSPEDNPFKLKADLIPLHQTAVEQGCLRNFTLLFFL